MLLMDTCKLSTTFVISWFAKVAFFFSSSNIANGRPQHLLGQARTADCQSPSPHTNDTHQCPYHPCLQSASYSTTLRLLISLLSMPEPGQLPRRHCTIWMMQSCINRQGLGLSQTLVPFVHGLHCRLLTSDSLLGAHRMYTLLM
jgi:hypothetical protein